MIVHLSKDEKRLLHALYNEYPGGIRRTDDLLDASNTLESLGLAESTAIDVFTVGVQITEAGRQYVRGEKEKLVSLAVKIAAGIVTLILIPVLVNLVSAYLSPLLLSGTSVAT